MSREEEKMNAIAKIELSGGVLHAPEGDVTLTLQPNGRTRVTLVPKDPAMWLPMRSCATSHPDEVPLFLDVIGFQGLVAQIDRNENIDSVIGVIRHQLEAYAPPGAYSGARILDFGCGAGGSTFGMADLLPQARLVGLELDDGLVRLASEVARRRQVRNIEFKRSPDGDSLPADLDMFDFIMLSAVFEHLLPAERKIIMPKLWAHLKPGGVLFINQTPHSWFPYDHHSTGLWGINYLPDRVAHAYARRFSHMNPLINRSDDWNVHLRGGIRGASEFEVLKAIGSPDAAVMQPVSQKSRAAYWRSNLSASRASIKNAIATVFATTDKLFGVVPSMNLDMAVRKSKT
jgi:2-polyprenyl-3-methyl-5-hydroxy-6-metoxy-1,4-benzoquinol methylase